MLPVAGKLAWADNPGRFNSEASASYQSLTPEDKENLRAQVPSLRPMTNKEALRRGEQIFKRMKKMVYMCTINIL